jgi:hypothetical protein
MKRPWNTDPSHPAAIAFEQHQPLLDRKALSRIDALRTQAKLMIYGGAIGYPVSSAAHSIVERERGVLPRVVEGIENVSGDVLLTGLAFGALTAAYTLRHCVNHLHDRSIFVEDWESNNSSSPEIS